MDNRLKIMVEAGINVGSSLKNINEEIKGIGKHPSLQKLNLSVSVDKSFVKAMNEFVAATKVLSTALEQQQKVINESVKTTKMLDGSIEKVTQRQLANGSIITQTTKKINEETKALNDQKKTLNDLSKELNGYTLASSRATKNKLGEATGSKNTYANDKNQKVTVNLDNSGNVKNYSELTNYLKQKEETLKKSEALDKAHYQALQEDQARRIALINKNLKEEEQRNQQFVNQLRTRFAEEQKIARNRDALDKAHAAAITENLNRKKAVADMEAKITAAQSKFKGNASAVAELTALNAQLGNISKVSNYKNALTELQTKLTQITSQAKLAGNEAKTLGQRFADAASKVALWGGATTSLYTVIRALKDMTNIIIQVDSQVTQLKRVMDESTDFEGMLSRSIQLANELGRSITEVNENAIGFARMGFDEDQTMNLAKTSTLLQNISELTPQESVDTLTAAMTIFNVEAGKSIEIANKLNEIDNNFAVTTQNLATSMTRAGASANTFGVSMEELLGHTTAIATATRESGAIIGNSLKSVYSRITTMDKSEGVLAEAGVSMRDLSGETRDVSDIIAELAGKWNGLSKETQQNTAVNLAGRYQLTRFLALMQNFPIAIEATETALHSQGSATRENEKYMQSLEARIQKMKTAWETLSVAFGEKLISNSIVDITSLMSGLMNTVAYLVDHVGALPVVFGIASLGVMALRTSFRLLIIEIVKTVSSVTGLKLQSIAASGGLGTLSMSAIKAKLTMQGLKASILTVGVALKGLLITSGIGLLFVGLGWAIEKVIGLFSDATKATEDFTDKAEELNQKQYDLSNLKALSKEYDELSKKTELSFEEKSRLAQIESELSSKYNITTTSVDGQTKSYEENNKAIQTQLGLKEDELKAARLAAEIEYNSNADKIERDIEKEKKALLEREKAYDDALAAYEANKTEWAKYDPVKDSYEYGIGKRANERLAVALKEQDALLTESKTSLQTTLNAKVLAYKGAGQSFVDEQESNNVEIKGLTREFLDIYAAAAAESGVSSNEFSENIKKVFYSIQRNDLANAEEGMNLLKEMPGITDLTATSLRNLSAALSRQNYQPVAEGLDGVADSADNLSNATDQTGQKVSVMSQKLNEMAAWATESKEDLELLNKAQTELAKKNTLSADTVKKMNDKYGDFIKVTGLSKDKILEFIKARKDEKKSFIDTEIEKTNVLIKASLTRIATIEAEMSARQKAINQIKEEYSDIAGKDTLEDIKTESRMGGIRSAISDKQVDLTEEKDKLNELMGILNTWKGIGSDVNEVIKNGDKAVQDATKSNDKSNQSYTDTNEILTETQKKLLSLADAIKKVQNERSTMVKGSKEYIASLKEEKKLLDEKIAKQEDALKNPSELVSTKIKTTTKAAPGESAPTSTSTSTSSNKSSTSSGSGTKLDTMLSAALGMQGQFKYQQIGGKFKGTFEEFKKRALADCSQFVQEFFEEFMDITLPRTAAQQSQQGTAVAKKDLKKGDLIFFETKKGYEASHVGIYTGNGKFIQMGTKSGLSEQSLDSSYWAPKYRSARRINGVGESTSTTSAPSTNSSATKVKTTSSDGKTTTEIVNATAKEREDAVRDTDLTNSSDKAQSYQLGIEIVEGVIAGSESAISALQSKRELSANKQSRYTQDSPEWRKEEMAQSSYLQQEQKLVEQENKDIRQQLIEQKITKGEYDLKLAENSAKWWDYQAQIDEKRKNVFDSQLSSYDKQIKADDDALAISDANLKLMTEGSVEYNKELKSQIPILEHKSSVLAKEIEYTKSLLASGKLNAEMTAYYNDRLQTFNLTLLDTNSALADVNKTLKDMRESAADNIIEEYKKVIEQRRDLELEALDQLREKEDKRHEKAIKNIDDEQKKFENYINARLKAFDRENTGVDYTEELQKKMDERQKITNKLNEISGDKSMDAKARRKELNDQLAAIDEEIRKFERDRERELIKQGLQDQLDDHKNYNDKIKDEEDKAHQDTLDKLDDEKKKTERKYKDILEDQKKFYDLKKGLMSNDAIVVTATLGIISGEYDKLFANIKDHTFETSKQMQNMVQDFQTSMEGLNKYKIGDYSPVIPGESSSGSSGDSGTIKGTVASRQAWTEYLSNKQSAESIKEQMKKLDKSSTQYKNLENDFNKLKTNNDQLRSVYGFPDGSYKDLVSKKIFSAESGGITPSDVPAEGQYILAHKKELILKESDTGNILDVVNIVRGITDKFKGKFDFSNLFNKKNESVSSDSGNKIHIDKIEIHASDKDTANSLGDKFTLGLQRKLNMGMI
jgi:TP901 family phage tail tape measure protein